ncbi:hypothetical protein [Hyphomicrobium sulfonivorans]|uniref:hypothetical protein n=1 Tax=Hyphomicrobium sulfonivorans TaxID=121290 RepID=UPI000838CB8A|nr:hypothetical protein [Hyphomicrobium sulfonivorans]
MTDYYVFADEAGCFTFNNNQNVSRYFMLVTLTTSSLAIGDALQDLRRAMLWDQSEIGDLFHATEDRQRVRDRVFEALIACDFTIQAQVWEKSKTQPHIRVNRARFYKYAWFYLFRHGMAARLARADRALITAASLGTKKEKLSFQNALQDVMQQTMPNIPWAVDFRPSLADPCLQAVD